MDETRTGVGTCAGTRSCANVPASETWLEGAVARHPRQLPPQRHDPRAALARAGAALGASASPTGFDATMLAILHLGGLSTTHRIGAVLLFLGFHADAAAPSGAVLARRAMKAEA